MKLIKFSQGDNEILIDPEKVSRIRKEATSAFVLFDRANEWQMFERFDGKDAENIWDYFSKT